MTRNGSNWTAITFVTALASIITLQPSGTGLAAESNASAAKRWGLIGTWRTDCNAPISRSRPKYNFAIRDGFLYHERNFGDTTDSRKIALATVQPDGTIELLTTFEFTKPPQTRLWNYVKDGGRRKRVIWNRNVNSNRYTIKGGRILSSGKQSVWQYKCR